MSPQGFLKTPARGITIYLNIKNMRKMHAERIRKSYEPRVVEHIEHQAKVHEARVLMAAARKQLQEIDDTDVGGPGGDG